MASSEVEISSPFGCVLRDHNRRQFYRENSAKKTAAFQKNLKELVRDRLHNRISVSSEENCNSNNSANRNDAVLDSWLAREQGNQSHRRSHDENDENQNNVKKNSRSNDDSSIISSKQSRIYDRWAAKQAREMVSHIEKQSREAELLAVSESSSNSNRENLEIPRNSNNNSNNTSLESGSSQLGASSLVQIWEARLNRSNSMNLNLHPVLTTSSTSSGLSNAENVSTPCVEEGSSSRGSEMGDSVDERDENRPNNEDWESQGRHSDAVESERERVRIADIIKRLTSCNDDNDNEVGADSPSRERRHSSVSDQAGVEMQREHRIGGFPQVIVSSPKIRGRQAFADLLMQMERERHRELDSLCQRQAVTRFPQRGRIQSLLRLRFLQRGLAVQEEQRTQSSEAPVIRLSQGATIMHLREKFNAGFDNGVAARSGTTSSRNTHAEAANNVVDSCNSSAINQESKDQNGQEVSMDATRRKAPVLVSEPSVSQPNEDHPTESRPRMDVTEQVTSTDTPYLESQGTSETRADSGYLGSQETNSQEDSVRNSQVSSITTASVASSQNENETENSGERGMNEQQQLYLASQESIEMPELWNDWDDNELAAELEEDYEEQGQDFVGTNYDWISEISRPRSYWEDRRREWYNEMLSSSPNEEIRQLLERRRVSTFLASDFRDTMDTLMASRVQRQTNFDGYLEEHEEYSQERMGQMLLSFLQRDVRQTNSHQEEQGQAQAEEASRVEQEDEEEQRQETDEEGEEECEEEEEEEEEEEMQSPTGRQFQEASDYFDRSSSMLQMPSPSLVQTWSFGDQEVADDSDHPIPSTSSIQPLPPQAYYQDSQQSSSSTTHLSVEMELVYDLRGQMEQLQREMAELRRSLHHCMNMQKPQNSARHQEVHSAQGMGNHSLYGMPKKHNCCICYETQVDSLLYRCGHMCTCIKCAHELQWSSGKCPICRAPIEDVVRAYMDS